MQLTTLINAIGQRKEAPAVEALVIQLGGKVPLPSKREGYFTAKKHRVELAWNTEVLTPAFYPPKKTKGARRFRTSQRSGFRLKA
jgi:hypothetical protein